MFEREMVNSRRFDAGECKYVEPAIFYCENIAKKLPFFSRQLPVAAFRSGHFEGREGGSKELMGPFGTR